MTEQDAICPGITASYMEVLATEFIKLHSVRTAEQCAIQTISEFRVARLKIYSL